MTPHSLHVLILRPPSSFRHRPVYKLTRSLDGAALAMHAVLSIDDQLPLAAGGLIGLGVFVHTSRAETLLRPVKGGDGHSCKQTKSAIGIQLSSAWRNQVYEQLTGGQMHCTTRPHHMANLQGRGHTPS